ncbi:MAG: hypothetical protein GY909_09490 [Oligoflexia bacterium]|nr:hypothetical protein [Oligoflexia bacterium]
MKLITPLFLLTFLVLSSADVFAIIDIKAMAATYNKGWKKERVKKGFSVYTRDEPNSDLVGIKVEGTIDAALPCTMSNLREVEASSEWIPGQIKKTTLKEVSDLEAVTYSLSDLPWPLNNREMILHNQLHLDLENDLLYVVSKSVNHPDHATVPEDTVRAIVHYSNVGLRPVTKKKTYVELTVFVDPKGSIPSWVVNFYQQGWPIEFIKALETRCQSKSPKLLPGLKRYMHRLLKDMKLPKNLFDN